MATKKTVKIFKCDEFMCSGEVIMDITIKDVLNSNYVDITRSIRKCNECKAQYGLKQLEKLENLY